MLVSTQCGYFPVVTAERACTSVIPCEEFLPRPYGRPSIFETMAEYRYRPQLDSLRGCAAIIVMLHHYLSHPFFLSGFGVILFFVLSGFFATRLLLKLKRRIEACEITTSNALTQFYFDRYLRIFPIYYLVLLVTALMHVPYAHTMLPWNGLFVSNFAMLAHGEWPGRFSAFWSLSVLEQFYLAWPLLILFCPTRRLPVFTGVVVAIAPLYRIVCLLFHYNALAWCVMPMASFDSLGCGALLAIGCADAQTSRFLHRLLLIGGRVCAPLLIAALAADWLGLNIPSLAIWIPLVAALCFVRFADRALHGGFGGWLGKVLNSRVLAWIGQMSYSVFLLHNFSQLLLPHPPIIRRVMASDWRAALLIPATLFFAYFSWRYLEIPIRTFRKALLLQLSSEVAAAAGEASEVV